MSRSLRKKNAPFALNPGTQQNHPTVESSGNSCPKRSGETKEAKGDAQPSSLRRSQSSKTCSCRSHAGQSWTMLGCRSFNHCYQGCSPSTPNENIIPRFWIYHYKYISNLSTNRCRTCSTVPVLIRVMESRHCGTIHTSRGLKVITTARPPNFKRSNCAAMASANCCISSAETFAGNLIEVGTWDTNVGCESAMCWYRTQKW